MRGVEFEPAKNIKEDGWNATTLHLYSHAGTHMDAPTHFEVNNGSVDQYPVDRFFNTCHLIDLIGIQPNTEIRIEDLRNVKQILKKGEGLIFRTGWSKFQNNLIYRDGLPPISKKLALWCAEKGVSVVGVEPPSVADVNNLPLLTEIHTILLKADILIVEGLTNLEQISKPKVKLIALPLKVEGGDGAPCRVIVIED